MKQGKDYPIQPGPERLHEKIGEETLRSAFSECADFRLREMVTGGGCRVLLAFLEGVVSGSDVAEQILRPLTDPKRFCRKGERDTVSRVMHGGVTAGSVVLVCDINDLIGNLLSGSCAILFPKSEIAVTADVKSEEKRPVDLPKEEKVVKGAKDAFVESIRTNSSLVRRKIKNRNLKLAEFKAGTETMTSIYMVYIKGVADENVIDSIRGKLNHIPVEGVLMAQTVQEILSDDSNTLLPQVIYTERPDKFALNLLEGRVGIFVDGLPMGFLLPGTFSQFMKTPEDLAEHPKVSTCLLLLRYGALLMSLLLPGFFVALAMYHQEMIPLKLLKSMIDAKQSVPFPVAVEVLGMLISFEVLMEAGLRLPNPIGDTVSIIGALIVGQSAVEAKVVSPVVIIVIAASGLAGYTVPNQDLGTAVRIYRFLLTICAIAAGIFGLLLGAAAILMRACSLESCQIAYLTPFSEGEDGWRGLVSLPTVGRSLQKSIFRRGNGR